MAENDPRKARVFKPRQDVQDQSEEDPLVELARIVGEENSYGSRQDKATAGHEDGVDRRGFSADLESELLNELESSMSPRNVPPVSVPRSVGSGHRSPVRPAVSHSPPPAEPEDGDELMRSIEEQLSAFERRNQSARPAQVAAAAQPNWSGRSEQLRARERSPRQAEPDDTTVVPVSPAELGNRGQHRGVLRAAAAPDPGPIPGGSAVEHGTFRADPVRSRPAAPPVSAVQAGGVPPRSRDERLSVRQVPLRPERAVQPSFAPGATAGWNEIDDAAHDADDDWSPAPTQGVNGLRTTFDGADNPAGNTTAQAAARSAHIEAELARELESDYSDPTVTPWPGPNAPTDDNDLRVAGAGGYQAPRAAKAGRRRARRGLLALALLLMVALIGGGAAMYLRSADQVASGPPPVIAAPEGAVKVAPAAPQETAQETVGQAVYNRVAGATEPAEEQVVESAEEPEEISRIVLPPPEPAPVPANAGPSSPEGAQADPGAAAEPTSGPRRVRTYLVRPDGTIVSSEEAGAASAAAAETPPAEAPEEQQVAALPEARPAEPVTVPTTAVSEPADTPTAESAPVEPATPPAPVGETAGADEADAAAAPLAADASSAIADLAPTQAPDVPAVAPAGEAPLPPGAPAPAEVASAAETAEPPPAVEGNFVQVSSQRSMEAAQSSFAGMKQQFSSVLGPLSADIQEADLGAKGTYYRVRVGPYATRAEAIQVCEQLKAAGGSCIVTK